MPEVHYTITYLESSSIRYGWFRRTNKVKCEKCNKQHAVLKITNNDNPSNEINTCTDCYNSNSTEALLVSRFEIQRR